MIFDINSFEQLEIAIQSLRPKLHGVIYLEGDLGVGKTTFVAHLLAQMGYQEVVTSPTYTLINDYHIQGKTIYHIDLYRLCDPEELMYLDVRDWQSRADLILIEWATKGEGYLPQANLILNFTLNAQGRTLQVKDPN